MKRLWILVLVLFLAACDISVLTYDSNDSSTIDTAVITHDGTDSYSITGTNGAVTAAPLDDNTSGNLREAFWPTDSPVVPNAQTCATWTQADSDHLTQEGAALQITNTGGVTRAVTVTKNVWLSANWIFNFHVWDSSVDPAAQQFASFDLSSVFVHNGVQVPMPWHLCAQIVRIHDISFKAWPDSEPEPRWGDSTHGGSATIPDGWGQPGQTGWYIGHLAPGSASYFSGLTTWKIVPDTTTTTTSSTTIPEVTTTTNP